MCIVLFWWVRAVGTLDNKPSRLGFMDGPFEVRLALSKLDSVVCSCIRRGIEADTTLTSSVVIQNHLAMLKNLVTRGTATDGDEMQTFQCLGAPGKTNLVDYGSNRRNRPLS